MVIAWALWQSRGFALQCLITYSSKEDVEEDNSHKRADVEDTTEHEHQNIPPLVIILLSTTNPAVVKNNFNTGRQNQHHICECVGMAAAEDINVL